MTEDTLTIAQLPETVIPDGGVVYTDPYPAAWANDGSLPLFKVVKSRGYLRSALFGKVTESALEPDKLLHLARQPTSASADPALWKCVMEAVLEEGRLTTLPDAPSRLDGVWLAPDRNLAWLLSEMLHRANGYGPRRIYEGETAGKWVVATMNILPGTLNLGSDESSVAAAIDEMRAVAHRYWCGERPRGSFPEYLAEGFSPAQDLLFVRGSTPSFAHAP